MAQGENGADTASEANGAARYKALFDSLPDGLVVCDVVRDAAGTVVDLIYRDVNKAVERQTGLGRDHFIGKRLSQVSDSEDFSDSIAIHARVDATGEPAKGLNCSQDDRPLVRIHQLQDRPG